MTNQDRIRLAEAMGWNQTKYGRWNSPDGSQNCQEPPDPFTDANDDYAVLLWMRGQGAFNAGGKARRGILAAEMFCYQIGDYARAALKVIDA